MRTALIDGDCLVYNAGFASDAQAKRQGVDHEPLEYCLQIVKQKLLTLMERAGCDEHVIYLSHPVNHREIIFPDYKANRNVTHKPYWYQEIIEYLIDHQGAIYSQEGDEADDALGIHQMRNMMEQDEWDRLYGTG